MIIIIIQFQLQVHYHHCHCINPAQPHHQNYAVGSQAKFVYMLKNYILYEITLGIPTVKY